MFKNKKSYFITILGFALLIVIASIILYLPICNINHLSFKDVFYNATSGLTTTGFVKGTLLTDFSLFGQFIIMILMEIGALGFMIFISYFWTIRNKKMRISDIIVINDSISSDNYGIIRRETFYIIKFMVQIQIVGFILLLFKFIPMFGVFDGIWKSLFHTISAFSNTGFDIFGNNSLEDLFKDSIYVQYVTIFLMVIGSLGIFVIQDIKENWHKRFTNLKLQTKIIIIYTVILLLVPTLLMWITENNMSFANSLFMSAGCRSTGFSIVDLAGMSDFTKVLLTILMFIGGGPTSTAGGIRIMVFAVLFSTMISTLKGKKNTIVGWRKISSSTIRKASSVFTSFLIVIIFNTMLLLYFNNLGFLEILFDVVSGISNTGLMLNGGAYNLIGDIIIMITMFIGRVGPMTMLLAFVNEDKKVYIDYPEENIVL